jgi:hypothetical protein
MHADEAGINHLSERIIGCAFRVLNTLGAGGPGKNPTKGLFGKLSAVFAAESDLW